MKPYIKILFGLSITLNILLAIGILITLFKFKSEILAKISASRSHAVVMFGDSLIFNANWNVELNRNDIYNAGTPGFTTSHFVWLVHDKVIKHKPKICFVEGGINDIAVGIPLTRTFTNFVSIIDTLLAYKIEPVLQSTLYINSDTDTLTNLKVDTLNIYLKNLAKKRNIDFIDLNASLASNGKLKRNLTFDGIHLKKEGYKIWAPRLTALLKKKKL